jgi:hypothetical protein
MMKAVFMRSHGGILVPVDPYAEQLVSRCKVGEGISVEAKKFRNIRFHRKFFSLLNLAFEMWEPMLEYIDNDTGEIMAKDVFKNFESFREEILILAGHCDQVFSVDGKTFKLRARSVSFARCDDYEFERIYRDVLAVIWNKVLRYKQFASPDDADAIVNKLLGYE